MIRNYVQRFQLKNGKFVYVQEDSYQERARTHLKWWGKKWTPPNHYFHYRDGGHVAALKEHLGSCFFARADLEKFFWHVTRNKITRALKRIGIPYADARQYAQEATVADGGRYFLPFGFVQSPYLATLCLEKSKMGECFRDLRGSGLKLSVYVDDVILSGDDHGEVERGLDLLSNVGKAVGFPLNMAKVQRAGAEVLAFNIHAGTGRLEVADQRMKEFAEAIFEEGDGPAARAIIAYVATVNPVQADVLEKLLHA